METSGSSAGKDSLGKETCWMAANTENSPRERQRHGEPGAWLGEDGWRVGEGSEGHRSGAGGSWGNRRGCGKEKTRGNVQGKQDACEKQVVRSLSETKRRLQGRQGEEEKEEKASR